MKNLKTIFIVTFSFFYFVISCSKKQDMTNHSHSKISQSYSNAVAVLQPTKGNEAKGKVIFKKVADGIKVIATVNNLLPNSQHGFHIHQYGDISGADGKTTGGHFNPDGHDHKLPENSQIRHTGDMGNLSADAKGTAVFEKIFDNLSLNPSDKNYIVGRGVIVHLKRDDGTGATGNAGPRIAMGVIGLSK